jgi:hypothetical protein
MNKRFCKKMFQSFILGREAVKELLPENTRKVVDVLEKDAVNSLKEFVLEVLLEDENKEDDKGHKESKKIEVEF